MKCNIDLKYNYGFQWYSKNGVHVKGFLYDCNDKLYRNEDLISYYNTCSSTEDFLGKCKNANGNFVVIVEEPERVFLATDMTRTFPLFYLIDNNEIFISDDAYAMRDSLDLSVDTVSIEEFLFTSYVTGQSTLLKNLNQNIAGELLVFDNAGVEHLPYFDYTVTKKEVLRTADSDSLLSLLRKATRRMIDSVDGSTIVIPLSGGYDSRLIAVLLKEQGYENVICFTYGDINNAEVQISKKVAETLGFRWLFVDYVDMEFDSKFFESEEFNRYYKFANNMVSVFLLQDYFAVRHLRDNNLVPVDSVIIPGHSGDFNVGNHLYPLDRLSRTNASCSVEIIKRHYILNQKSVSKALLNKVKGLLPDKGISYSRIENFNLKERQAKLIINANRVYEFFGYQHRMLFWDKDLVEFFRTLQFSDKLNSKLYFDTIINDLFVPNDVHIVPEDKKGNRLFRNLKQAIPYKIAVLLRNRSQKNLQIDTKKSYFKVFTSIIAKYNLKSHICTGISAKWLIRNEFGIKDVNKQ